MAGLTPKQEVWLKAYLRTWNATEAARIAGYQRPNKEGPENRVKPGIAALIQEHIEAIMPAGEVLTLLADEARGTMEDFIDPDTETLDLQKAARNKKLHLIKRFTRRDTETGSQVSIELYSAHDARVQMGKHHGLFKEVIDVRFNPGDLTDEQLARIAAGEDPGMVLRG